MKNRVPLKSKVLIKITCIYRTPNNHQISLEIYNIVQIPPQEQISNVVHMAGERLSKVYVRGTALKSSLNSDKLLLVIAISCFYRGNRVYVDRRRSRKCQ